MPNGDRIVDQSPRTVGAEGGEAEGQGNPQRLRTLRARRARLSGAPGGAAKNGPGAPPAEPGANNPAAQTTEANHPAQTPGASNPAPATDANHPAQTPGANGPAAQTPGALLDEGGHRGAALDDGGHAGTPPDPTHAGGADPAGAEGRLADGPHPGGGAASDPIKDQLRGMLGNITVVLSVPSAYDNVNQASQDIHAANPESEGAELDMPTHNGVDKATWENLWSQHSIQFATERGPTLMGGPLPASGQARHHYLEQLHQLHMNEFDDWMMTVVPPDSDRRRPHEAGGFVAYAQYNNNFEIPRAAEEYARSHNAIGLSDTASLSVLPVAPTADPNAPAAQPASPLALGKAIIWRDPAEIQSKLQRIHDALLAMFPEAGDAAKVNFLAFFGHGGNESLGGHAHAHGASITETHPHAGGGGHHGRGGHGRGGHAGGGHGGHGGHHGGGGGGASAAPSGDAGQPGGGGQPGAGQPGGGQAGGGQPVEQQPPPGVVAVASAVAPFVAGGVHVMFFACSTAQSSAEYRELHPHHPAPAHDAHGHGQGHGGHGASATGAGTQTGAAGAGAQPGAAGAGAQPGAAGAGAQPGATDAVAQTGAGAQPGATGAGAQPGATGAGAQPGAAAPVGVNSFDDAFRQTLIAAHVDAPVVGGHSTSGHVSQNPNVRVFDGGGRGGFQLEREMVLPQSFLDGLLANPQLMHDLGLISDRARPERAQDAQRKALLAQAQLFLAEESIRYIVNGDAAASRAQCTAAFVPWLMQRTELMQRAFFKELGEEHHDGQHAPALDEDHLRALADDDALANELGLTGGEGTPRDRAALARLGLYRDELRGGFAEQARAERRAARGRRDPQSVVASFRAYLARDDVRARLARPPSN